MNMLARSLLAISETLRRPPHFNLLLVTFVKETGAHVCRAWTRGDVEGGEGTGRQRPMDPPAMPASLPPLTAHAFGLWPRQFFFLPARRRLKWQQSWKMLSVTTAGSVSWYGPYTGFGNRMTHRKWIRGQQWLHWLVLPSAALFSIYFQ